MAPLTGPPCRNADRGGLLLRGVGQILVTAGLVLLLFVVYELFVTDLLSDRQQESLSRRLRAEWAREEPAGIAPDPGVGTGFAALWIPRLGTDYRRVIVEGTGAEQLAQGPGHYEGTALPGEIGNVAIAGHRVGRGSPFEDLDQLLPGDPIVLETADSWFLYRVLGNPATGDFSAGPDEIPGREIVLPTDVSVIAPVPGEEPQTEPRAAYLTLTTCHPKFSARQRLVVHAVLDGARLDKDDAPHGPPALQGP